MQQLKSVGSVTLDERYEVKILGNGMLMVKDLNEPESPCNPLYKKPLFMDKEIIIFEHGNRFIELDHYGKEWNLLYKSEEIKPPEIYEHVKNLDTIPGLVFDPDIKFEIFADYLGEFVQEGKVPENCIRWIREREKTYRDAGIPEIQ
jgi:hypothetical protein